MDVQAGPLGKAGVAMTAAVGFLACSKRKEKKIEMGDGPKEKLNS